ncbi:alpha-glucan family phosphorylase [Methylobacter psychrophilus]|uniref:alpha-glucan family phosphorylase n=1 Tax=Methylobacter psychrophilus TaxID=96941 RepID=UPI0021D4BB52|nr:alpha-glucan family phosphorylase [Methylobacter psychrophilus]
MQHPYFPRTLPAELKILVEFALDLRWTWSHAGDALWQTIDPKIWQRTQNPWLLLQKVSKERLEALVNDSTFLVKLKELKQERAQYYSQEGWFQCEYADCQIGTVAYFSMEYGLGEALPIYAGGLGILAGDLLKSASDLNLPLVGIGLLYQQGYFRQMLDAQGAQQAFYPYNEPASLPIRPALDKQGNRLTIVLELPARDLFLRVWEVQVGRISLYLLDSNDLMNSPVDQAITAELYGGGHEMRLLQEIVLGIGGWRLLEALGIKPEICHLNEGHAAFVALARIGAFQRSHQVTFEEALWATRAGNIFTTHTPVSAGFDRFSPQLLYQYLSGIVQTLAIPFNQFLALGQTTAENPDELFTMTYFALRTCAAANGVSRLHGQVSQQLFHQLYPHWLIEEIPVGYVTNGVHVPTWDSSFTDALWTNVCGKERWTGKIDALCMKIEAIQDETIWTFRTESRTKLVRYIRQRISEQWGLRRAPDNEQALVQSIFDPNILTLGFARRFAEYKRPNLLLHDPDRLLRLLTNARYPIQLVIAGKAHPADRQGQRLIQEMTDFVRRPDVRKHMVFMADYDMAMAEQFVQGVDVWINTPRRPWEACGTSGMKLLANGGLNLSELDGWWAEAYTPEVGWALGDGQTHTEPEWDAVEANALYSLLEEQIIPEFYQRDERGIPEKWVARIRASMSTLAPEFSSNRMLRDYVENYYAPATARYRQRINNDAAIAKELALWQKQLAQHWPTIYMQNLQIEPTESSYRLTVHAYLDDLSAEFVRLEIYANANGDNKLFCRIMERKAALTGSVNGYVYELTVPADRPADHYTPRIVANHCHANIPAEEAHIKWYC